MTCEPEQSKSLEQQERERGNAFKLPQKSERKDGRGCSNHPEEANETSLITQCLHMSRSIDGVWHILISWNRA